MEATLKKAFLAVKHPCLQGMRVLKVSFHSQSLFALYRMEVMLPKKQKVSKHIACKVMDSYAMAEAEKEALEILWESKIPVPEVYDCLSCDGKALLFMEFISSDIPSANFTKSRQAILSCAAGLAADMLQLYQKQYPRYGWAKDNFIGSLKQKNAFYKDFSSFWWESRILPQFRMAHQSGLVPASLGHDLEAIVRDCAENWSLDGQAPRLVHGDLWSGNLLAGCKGRLYWIDPALSYGNPEQDLAMLGLFGGPLSMKQKEEIAQRVGAGAGFAEREAFWQIYPLLVHINIFGAAYLRSLEKAMSAYRKLS